MYIEHLYKIYSAALNIRKTLEGFNTLKSAIFAQFNEFDWLHIFKNDNLDPQFTFLWF